MAEFVLDVTQEDYEKSGSKFVTFPISSKAVKDRVGEELALDVSIGMLDWEKPGESMKVPMTVTQDGPDKAKEEKISFGVKPNGIWKGKEIYRAITGQDMPFKKGSDGKMHPVIDPMKLAGKPAVGIWVMTAGKKGGRDDGEPTYYPKLDRIIPVGQKSQNNSLGI